MAKKQDHQRIAVRVDQLEDQLALGVATKQITYIEGPPGVGKTGIIKNFAEENGYEPLCFMVSECLPEDFGGIVAADLAEGVARRLMPDIVARMHSEHARTGKPILAFFDEINNGSQMVFSSCMKLLHEGVAAGFAVPEGTVFVAAGNPPETSSVAQELPAPLYNRMANLQFDGPTIAEFERYAMRRGVHPAVMSFLNQNPQWLLDNADFTGTGAQPTPRSWEAVSDVLNVIDKAKGVDKAQRSFTRVVAIAARVGDSAARMMEATLKHADQLESWANIRRTPESAKATESFVPAYMQVVAVVPNVKDSDDLRAALTYVRRLPAEIKSFFIRSLLDKDKAMTSLLLDVIQPDEMLEFGERASLAVGLKIKHGG
jgi:hypothetical protein